MQIPSYREMLETAAEWSAADGEQALAAAKDLLEALGIEGLLDTLETMERIIVAADGFHPVARFFADGSPEQRLILEVLQRRR